MPKRDGYSLPGKSLRTPPRPRKPTSGPAENAQLFRSVFISDIHLGYHGCRADLLLSFLSMTRTRNLFLVGDIIDLQSLQRRPYWPHAHSEVLQEFIKMAREGTRVVYIPGNHDAAMRRFCGLKTGSVEIRRRCLHTTADGRRLLVTHGDEFDCQVACPPLLTWLGSLVYRQLMKLHTTHANVRQRFGFEYWSLASFLKRHSGAAQRYIERFQDAVTASASQRNLDGVICGHIHRPDQLERNGMLYFNDGDWVENCTALVEHPDGQLELINWPQRLAQLQIGDRECWQSAA